MKSYTITVIAGLIMVFGVGRFSTSIWPLPFEHERICRECSVEYRKLLSDCQVKMVKTAVDHDCSMVLIPKSTEYHTTEIGAIASPEEEQ